MKLASMADDGNSTLTQTTVDPSGRSSCTAQATATSRQLTDIALLLLLLLLVGEGEDDDEAGAVEPLPAEEVSDAALEEVGKSEEEDEPRGDSAPLLLTTLLLPLPLPLPLLLNCSLLVDSAAEELSAAAADDDEDEALPAEREEGAAEVTEELDG